MHASYKDLTSDFTKDSTTDRTRDFTRNFTRDLTRKPTRDFKNDDDYVDDADDDDDDDDAVMLVGARTTDAYPVVERLISKQCVEVVASASCECSELGLGSYHPHQILEPLTWVEFHCHGMGYIGLHWAPAKWIGAFATQCTPAHAFKFNVSGTHTEPVCLSGSASKMFGMSIRLRVEIKVPRHHLCLNSQIV
jgi:hypothetical protein